jgi:hypothetical protein
MAIVVWFPTHFRLDNQHPSVSHATSQPFNINYRTDGLLRPDLTWQSHRCSHDDTRRR